MDKELIINAINSAIYLTSNELESVCNDELKTEYEQTLDELNLALNELLIEKQD